MVRVWTTPFIPSSFLHKLFLVIVYPLWILVSNKRKLAKSKCLLCKCVIPIVLIQWPILFQDMVNDTCFTLLTPVASPFNVVHKGGKEGFCWPYSASSALVSVCAAPFAGRWVSLSLKAMKYSLEGRLQENIKREDLGESARTKPAGPPKFCGLVKQVPKGSMPWTWLKQRLLGSRGDFKVFLAAQDVFAGPKASLKKKISHCELVFHRETIYKPLHQHYVLANSLIFQKMFTASTEIWGKKPKHYI